MDGSVEFCGEEVAVFVGVWVGLFSCFARLWVCRVFSHLGFWPGGCGRVGFLG